MKKELKTYVADVQGPVNAVLVTRTMTVRKPSKRVKRMLSRKKLATFLHGAATILKGAYIMSIVMAMMTAASLLEAGTDTGRLVACIVWVITPVTLWIMKERKQ